MNDISLDDALTRLGAGERAAFDEVFNYAWPRVLRYCERLLKDPDDAKDAAQLAMEKVFFRASEYQTQYSAMTWILAIATWEIRTAITRRKRNAKYMATFKQSNSVKADQKKNPEEAMILQRMITELEHMLSTLSPEDKQLIEDIFYDRQTVIEGVKPATIRKRRQRVLDKIRHALRVFYGQ